MRKPKYVMATVVLNPRLRAELDRVARDERRSRSSMLRVLLERALAPAAGREVEGDHKQK